MIKFGFQVPVLLSPYISAKPSLAFLRLIRKHELRFWEREEIRAFPKNLERFPFPAATTARVTARSPSLHRHRSRALIPRTRPLALSSRENFSRSCRFPRSCSRIVARVSAVARASRPRPEPFSRHQDASAVHSRASRTRAASSRRHHATGAFCSCSLSLVLVSTSLALVSARTRVVP